MSTENMNGSQNGVSEEKGTAADVGIAPGLHGEYIDPHLKAQREYESDYAKLALQGGHKGSFFYYFIISIKLLRVMLCQ